MQRIDSPNARDDVNGPGKRGFHDNSDLPGHDATYLTPTFLNTVQEELATAIELSGLDLDPNDPSQLFKLFNLHNKSLVQKIYHVGSKHMTENKDWNPAVELEPYFGYQTTWMLWPFIPFGVENFLDPLGTIKLLSTGQSANRASTLRIWSRLADGASAPTYILTASSSAINEGQQVTFTLQTTGLPEGTLVDWNITGIQSNDITPGALSGQFVLDANGQATYTITVTEDQRTEGNEVLSFGLSYIPNKSVDVSIIDTSLYPVGSQTYYQGSHSIEVQPLQTIVIDMYGAGGGGGGSVYSPAYTSPDGTDGGDVVLTYLSNVLTAGGGKKATGGVWGNGSSYSNGEAGVGGTNTLVADSSFTVLTNKAGNNAVIGSRWNTQTGGAGISSSIGAVNGGGNGATGIGDERWSYGGGGGGGGRLRVRFTNTDEDNPVNLSLNVGSRGLGWKNGGNSGSDGGIAFAIVTTQ